jgi:hypothetical protein
MTTEDEMHLKVFEKSYSKDWIWDMEIDVQ